MPSLLRLEVIEQDGPLLRLLTPVLNHDTRAINDLPSVAFTIDLTYRAPSRQLTNPSAAKPLEKAQHLHNPLHSPSCFPSGTLINGILCSPHSATTSFL